MKFLIQTETLPTTIKNAGVINVKSVVAFFFGWVSLVSRVVAKRWQPRLLFIVGLASISACSGLPNNLKMDDQGNYIGLLVVYDERESNENKSTFQTSIRILPHRMLISDNRNSSGYLLVDRQKHIIYNINKDDKTIMVIKSRAVSAPSPIKIDYSMKSQPSGAIPKVATFKATHYEIDVNGKHCYDTVSGGNDFLPDVTAALSEFRQIMAGEHAKSVTRIPKDMIDACDLALNIYHPVDHMKNGFPLREWGRHGYMRFIKFWKENEKIEPQALELPTGYETYSIP